MKVLIACESSGTVRNAFLNRGHDAISCDLDFAEPPHYHGDVRDILHYPWDMMIAHPPCTHTAVSGARWFQVKQAEGLNHYGVAFFMMLWRHGIEHIPHMAIEHPVSIMSSLFRKPDQIIQPWQFGHGETKATCLWLHNLPPLKPTNIVDERDDRIHKMPPGPDRSRKRSVTYPGIAKAMAEQWG